MINIEQNIKKRDVSQSKESFEKNEQEDEDIIMHPLYDDLNDEDITLFSTQIYTEKSDDETDISTILHMQKNPPAEKILNESDHEDYKQIVYHLNSISCLCADVSNWTEEQRDVVLQQIQQLTEKIKSSLC